MFIQHIRSVSNNVKSEEINKKNKTINSLQFQTNNEID
jgi:hypothetical protein